MTELQPGMDPIHPGQSTFENIFNMALNEAPDLALQYRQADEAGTEGLDNGFVANVAEPAYRLTESIDLIQRMRRPQEYKTEFYIQSIRDILAANQVEDITTAPDMYRMIHKACELLGLTEAELTNLTTYDELIRQAEEIEETIFQLQAQAADLRMNAMQIFEQPKNTKE